MTGCKKTPATTTPVTTTTTVISAKAANLVLSAGDFPMGWAVAKQPATAVTGFPSNSCVISINKGSQTIKSLAAVYSSTEKALKQYNTELTNTLKTISVNKVSIGDGGFIYQLTKGSYTVKFTKNNVYAYVVTTGLSYAEATDWAKTLGKKIQ